jgi:hypothetical protein
MDIYYFCVQNAKANYNLTAVLVQHWLVETYHKLSYKREIPSVTVTTPGDNENDSKNDSSDDSWLEEVLEKTKQF